MRVQHSCVTNVSLPVLPLYTWKRNITLTWVLSKLVQLACVTKRPCLCYFLLLDTANTTNANGLNSSSFNLSGVQSFATFLFD